jgi:glycerophosphoryl diester phosphodiesterase
MSTAQVRALRLNDGSRVPKLASLLRIASTSASVTVIPELKALGRDLDHYRDYARQVHAFGRRRVIASSFDTAQLHRLRRVAPHIRQSIIEERHLLTPEMVAPYDTVTIRYKLVTDEWLKNMPYPVFIFTANTPEEWKYANRVRAVITDEPVSFKAYQQTVCLAG